MKEAQKGLVQWAKKRHGQAQQEEDDLKENLEIATKNKWGTGGLFRAHERAVKLTKYYEKMLAALEAGYCLVPNFPVDIFAIRTTRKKAKLDSSDSAAFLKSYPQFPPIRECLEFPT